jgi:DNA repair exonuclease SbcCD ATPase subunit
VAERDPSSAGINIGGNARVSKIDVQGDVIGRDKVIGALADEASAAQDREQLLALIVQLQAQVKALEEAPESIREDASDELEKARKAGEQGDKSRLLEKLETARGYLEKMVELVPVGVQLAQAVAAIAQRANGLW